MAHLIGSVWLRCTSHVACNALADGEHPGSRGHHGVDADLQHPPHPGHRQPERGGHPATRLVQVGGAADKAVQPVGEAATGTQVGAHQPLHSSLSP